MKEKQENLTRETDSPKRIGFIDQCKGIGILLMIRGHCATIDWEASVSGAHAFREWIYSFHMPLFFILGGCLLAYKQESYVFPKTLTKKAGRLLLPGVYFSVFMIAMHTFIKALGGNDVCTYLRENLTELAALNFYSSMWFLNCYFFAEIIFLILMKILRTKHRTLIIIIVGFICGILTISLSNHLVRISRTLMAICLIGIGYGSYQVILQNTRKRENITNIVESNFTKHNESKIQLIGG